MVGLKTHCAVSVKDKKADYFTTVYAKLVDRITKPEELFKSYVLSLLSDREYEKVAETV